MAQIIELTRYKAKLDRRACYQSWHRYFKENFEINTQLGHLKNNTLCELGQPGELATSLLFDFILGALGKQYDTQFDGLNKTEQLRVIDVHLFLCDQIRFEIMYRLGWLSHFPGGRFPIVDLVKKFDEIKKFCIKHPPRLATSHPKYSEFERLIAGDQQVLIRRLLPSALEVFKLNLCSD